MSRISVLLLVLVLVTSSPAMVLPVRAESRTIVVPDDYPTVSLAIENAFAGDIVFVRKGNYQESTLEINKSLYLMGEDVEGTILSLNPPLVKTFILHNWLWILSSAVIINAENVKLQGLTISIPRDDYGYGGGLRSNGDRIELINNKIANNSLYLKGSSISIFNNSIASALEIIGSNQLIANNTIGNTLKVQGSFNQIYANDINSTYYFSGIQLNGSNNVLIKNSFQSMTMESSDSNIIGDNVFARLVMEHFGSGCSHNTITKNRVEGNGNFNDGIKVLSGLNNTISANNIRNCEYGLSIGSETTQTSVYLNNFYNSSEQHITCSNLAENRFDNGAKGNYYDTYHSNDGNWDGIGDSPYTIQEIHWDEELKREVTVIYFQDNYPLTAPFDIDSMSIQIPDWASASSNSIPEHQPAEPFPTIWLMATVGVTVIACIGVIVYFKTRISGK
jgi:nitrous oxidase accessory protein